MITKKSELTAEHKIPDRLWDRTVSRIDNYRDTAKKLKDFTGIEQVVACDKLLDRYADGERSEKLLDDMLKMLT